MQRVLVSRAQVRPPSKRRVPTNRPLTGADHPGLLITPCMRSDPCCKYSTFCYALCFSVKDGSESHLGTYNAIRRFSTLCKELNMQGNFFFETNKNLPHH
ncbi:hypothetical protein M5D96_001378 [Drosophila gunungcola]|uniref:Uncharacterized protein n=1 Tax=Drosophila gunungcola TaxID=103775 RepID=A0A9P9YXZ9_9MUSC|nr:hypothetical protein M5D96_001378 [Drosophila gunungcola]